MGAALARIAVIGNGGGGKTTLSRRLAELLALPLIHVDSVQYLEGFAVRPVEETRALLNEHAARERWIIDGFGPMDVMIRRFELADRVVFVDFPLWRHYWWCTKRQLQARRGPRAELPAGCAEGTLAHTMRLYRVLWMVHRRIRPRLLECFARPEIASRAVRVRGIAEWNAVFRGELG